MILLIGKEILLHHRMLLIFSASYLSCFLSFLQLFKALDQPALKAEEEGQDDAEQGLCRFIGNADDGRFAAAVDKRLSQSVSDHHDERTDERGKESQRKTLPLFSSLPVHQERDDECLQPMSGERDKHGGRVENHVAQEGADAADQHGRKGSQ